MSEEDMPELVDPEEEEKANPEVDLYWLVNNINITFEEEKYGGIPCPEQNTIPPVEAKPIILRCVICKENQVQTVNFPCMHACFCTKCASDSLKYSKNCPHCRTEYMHISMLYLCYNDSEEEQHKKRKI